MVGGCGCGRYDDAMVLEEMMSNSRNETVVCRI